MLRRMFLNDETKDVTFILDDNTRMKAHRFIMLHSDSTYFMDLAKEINKDLFRIHGCEPDEFTFVLKSLYEERDQLDDVEAMFDLIVRFDVKYNRMVLDSNKIRLDDFLHHARRYAPIFDDIVHRKDIKLITELDRFEHRDGLCEGNLAYLMKLHSESDTTLWLIGLSKQRVEALKIRRELWKAFQKRYEGRKVTNSRMQKLADMGIIQ